MIKFIDKNRKDAYYEDELLVRCTCGCSILSFRTSELTDDDGKETMPLFELVHYVNGVYTDCSKKAINKTSFMGFLDPQAVITIYGLATGELNNGQGYVQSQDSTFLGVNYNAEEKILSFYAVEKEKDIYAIQKKPHKAYKKIVWDVTFEAKEAGKVIDFIKSFLEKKCNVDILNGIGSTESSNEVLKI